MNRIHFNGSICINVFILIVFNLSIYRFLDIEAIYLQILFLKVLINLSAMGFTPCKVEQPRRGTELQENEVQKNQSIQKICLEKTYS